VHVVPHEDSERPEGAAARSAVAIGFLPGHQDAVLDLLRDLGEVTPAKDLETGLATARELRPTLILVAADLGEDPLDVLMVVRRDPTLRVTPVVTLAIDPDPDQTGRAPGRPGRGRDTHQVAQALQRLMLDEVMKVSYILASAAHSGNDTVDRQVMAAIARLDAIAIALRDAVIDLRRGGP
jgi:hypothetical protein